MSLGNVALKNENGVVYYYDNVGIIRVPNSISIAQGIPEFGSKFYYIGAGQGILITVFGRQTEEPYVDPPIQVEPGPGYLFFKGVATQVFNPSSYAPTIVNISDDVTAAGRALAKSMTYENGVLSWDGASLRVGVDYYSCPYTVELENHAETEKTVSFSWAIEEENGAGGYLQINGKNIAAEGVLNGTYSKALAAGEILYVTAVTGYGGLTGDQSQITVSLTDFVVT